MIDELTKGEAPSLLDTEKANEIIRAINALMGSRGANGIRVDADQNGELLIYPSDGKPILRSYHPFEVIEVAEDKVVINAGLVNGLLPDALTVDKGDGVQYICLEITGDADGVSTVQLKSEQNPPDGIPWEENGVNSNFKYPIAIVEEKELLSQIVSSNLFFKIGVAAEIPKDSVSIGEYPNEIYFTWVQTND
jgi:hypothetical protein